MQALIASFDECVRWFESTQAFGGPSLYFHERALERRRAHRTIDDLFGDRLFFEYLYAVLPSWGMHRMGPQAAKVGDFEEMVASFQSQRDGISSLVGLQITDVPEGSEGDVATRLWEVLSALKVSTSMTRIVAGSKALHHVLPDLMPPIDRTYTFMFFTGQKSASIGEHRAFLEWFPFFCRIGRAAKTEIDDAVSRNGFMATSRSKVIDNAIMGYVQKQRGAVVTSDD